MPERTANKIRPRIHKDWHGHPFLDRFMEELKRPPEDLIRLIFDVTSGDHKALKEYCKREGIPEDSVRHYWHKGKHFSVFSKTSPVDYMKIRDELIAELQAYSPEYKEIKRTKNDTGRLLVIDPADVHIGKLSSPTETGESYDPEIAIERVIDGVSGVLEKSRGFNISKILFIGGNDILHVDNTRHQTTSGTHQDTSGMWYDNFMSAKNLYISLLETLISFANIHFIFCPSNHDFMGGFYLCDVIATWFRKCQNITFDVDMKHRKYFRFHENLLGFSHGDGAKFDDLPLLMAHESDEWSSASKRYIYTHHVHHKVSKDRQGVTIESLRSPSPPDGWHHRNGYISKCAIEGFVHDPNDGQIARLTHYF